MISSGFVFRGIEAAKVATSLFRYRIGSGRPEGGVDEIAAGGGAGEGRTERTRGGAESGRSTCGGCEEYRVGLSIPGDVGGSGSDDGVACVAEALGTGVG